MFGSSLAYIVIGSRDVEWPVWDAQSSCHSFVCCCSQRLVVGDRVHTLQCTFRGNSLLFFFYTFVLSLSCLWAFTFCVINEIRMYGWRAFSWPFISHTLAVKK